MARIIPLVPRSSGQQHYQAIRNSPTIIRSVRHQHNGPRSQQDAIPTSTTLTHLDSSGRASMVSISSKTVTTRRATATGRIYLPPVAYDILARSPESFKKGDVLGTARIAGIMAGKRTSDLIPLCHPIGLTDLKVNFKLETATRDSHAMQNEGGYVCVQAVAECEGKTGVEMEALTAASSALLTVWDMVKAVAGKEMVIQDLMVTRKEGGKSGDWQRGTGSGATGMDNNYNL